MDPNSGNLISFLQLQSVSAASDAPLAFGSRGDRCRADFARDVARMAAAVASVGRGRWLVDTADRYLAAVGLFALAESGSVAVLPSAGPADPQAAWGADAVGLLAESESSETPLVATALAGSAGAPIESGDRRGRPWVEFRTSGTSGAGQPVVKAVRHLEDEVRILEARLGRGLPATTRIFATAAHRHIYGLLFGVLWPLASGRAFQRDILLHARELLPRLEECAASVLVTTPVHLKRMAESANLEALRGRCLRVFSSGGPLDEAVAHEVADRLGCAPFEIFGSTETGGVAIRCRREGGGANASGEATQEEWEPMPEVLVRVVAPDGRAEVTSPFVSTGERQSDGRTCTVMGDRIEMRPGGRFVLLGRADRVVKIAEKRLSLPEMERTLCGHPFVAEASLLVREIARESRVHAVVALSGAGREEFVREGSRCCRGALVAHLAKRYDRVFLPRAWRFVAALPRDGQDKIPQAALRALFDAPSASDRSSSPRTLGEKRSEEMFERRLEVPADLVHGAVHFPGNPLVPGVVQLDWALRAAGDWLATPLVLIGLKGLKYPEPLVPGGRVTLRLERGVASTAIRFRLFDGERVHLDGRAEFAVDRDLRSGE